MVENKPDCFYSNNLVIKCPDGKDRMLVQYSENYNDPKPGVWNAQVLYIYGLKQNNQILKSALASKYFYL